MSGMATTEFTAMMVEVCAGSALLSSYFQARGWQVRAVDWSRNSLGSVPHIKADLTTAMGKTVVQELFALEKCLCVVLSPPSFAFDELEHRCFWDELLETAFCRNAAVVIENVATSPIWRSQVMQLCALRHELIEVTFMSPGRTVCTKLLTNVRGLESALAGCEVSPL
eukprot:1294884-Amphidinium_carterae.1